MSALEPASPYPVAFRVWEHSDPPAKGGIANPTFPIHTCRAQNRSRTGRSIASEAGNAGRIPNAALVRVAFANERFLLGVTCLGDSGLYLLGLWAFAPAAVAARLFVKSLRRRVQFLFVAALVWSGYVVVIGGDMFPARRQLVPAIVWAALLLSLLVKWLAAEGRPFAGASWLLAMAMLGLPAWFQWNDPENRRALRERWEWDGQVVGNLLRRAFSDAQPLLACDAAGCLPYFSELPVIDMLEVNDRHTARTRPLTWVPCVAPVQASIVRKTAARRRSRIDGPQSRQSPTLARSGLPSAVWA